ncbi:MAG: LiaI-LiaF-like domain-containing protein [Candidatus Acidiferrales bacterium]
MFSGMLLILIGVLFLLHERIPGLSFGHLFRYWPVLLILWGLARLYDHMMAERGGGGRPPMIRGGEIGMTILVVFLVGSVAAWDKVHNQFPDMEFPGFSASASDTVDLPVKPVRPGARISIVLARGDIVVHTGTDVELRVAVSKSAKGMTDAEAHKKLDETTVNITESSDGYDIRPQIGGDARGISTNLDVTAPAKVSLTITTQHGDITVSGVQGGITASSQNGDIEVRDAGSDVSVQVDHGDARVLTVAGDARISGRGGEVEFGDVTGDATLDGEFDGPIRMHNIKKTAHFTSSRSSVTIAALTGSLDIDSDGMEISGAGDTVLTTRDKNISLEKVSGRIQIANRRGDIQMQFAEPPKQEISVTNDSASIELDLPANSSFELNAWNPSGDIVSDFESPTLVKTNGDNSRLMGKYGTKGPQIKLTTSYGTITLHKAGTEKNE